MFKERFNPMDDIIVSFAYTNNDSSDLGGLRLQGPGVNDTRLALEDTARNELIYNFDNSFNGLGIFLTDGRIPYFQLSGGGMSSAISAVDLEAGRIFSPYLSSGIRFYRQTNNLSGGFLSGGFRPADSADTPNSWQNEYYLGYEDGKERAAIYFDPNGYGHTSKGWVLSSNYYSNFDLMYTTASAGSGLQPWDVKDWKLSHEVSILSATETQAFSGQLSAGNSFTSFHSFSGINLYLSAGESPNQLDNPGMNLISNNKQPQYPNLPNTTGGISISSLNVLSGCFLIAGIDNNGAFGHRGCGIPLFEADSENPGTDFLSAGNFAVRSIPYGVPALNTAAITAFPLNGSVKPSEPTIVEDNWKVLRVGFKRRLQDVVLYKKEGDDYVVDHIINTNFSARTLPSSAVNIGLTFSGKMPMEIKNITINASTEATALDAGEFDFTGGLITSPDVEIVTIGSSENIVDLNSGELFVTINK